MRVRGGTVTSLVPIAVAMALLAFSVAGARMYGSSAASKAFSDQHRETCRSDSALTLPLPDGVRDEADVDAIAADLVHVDPAIRGSVTAVVLDNATDPPRRLTLIHLEGVERMVTPTLRPLGPGEIALSNANLVQLATEVGATLRTNTGEPLVVAQSFDLVPEPSVPDFWCGWSDFFDPTPGGDPPPPSAIASPETITGFGGVMWDEYRVTADPITIAQARDAKAAFDVAAAAWNQRYADATGELELNELRRVLIRAEFVTTAVQRTLAPVLLTAAVSVTVVLVAASVLLARGRRRELRLLAMRGLPPARIAVTTAPEVALSLSIGAAVGAVLAYGAVRWFGPSPLLEPAAIRAGLLTVAAAVLVGIPVVCAVVAIVGDRSVDRGRRRMGATSATTVAVAGLVALAVWSFRTLDRDGGIRTFGVESRGGSLMALGFPLFALLDIAAVAALVLAFVAKPLRLSGGALPRALRLGWRRVVLEPAPLSAIVVAVALAAGCLTTATALASAAQRQLEQKAEVYVGADVAINIYDEPALAGEDWATRTSLARTARGRLETGSFDLVGVDPATFPKIARMRGDASDLSLGELVALVTVSRGDIDPAPAIAVGSDASVGDIVSLEVPGNAEVVQVEVVASTPFFPAKSSGAEMFVVDAAVVEARVPFPLSVLFVRDPPDDVVAQLRAAGVRIGVVRDVRTAFDGSAYSALRWAYAPLAVLGGLFAVVAMALQLLVVAARAGARRATHAIMRRTGFGARPLFAASVVETAVPLLVGTLVGVGASVAAVSLAVSRLDPMPTLQPRALFEMPWTSIVAIALVLPVWTIVIAAVITRSTTRSDPLEVLHGAL